MNIFENQKEIYDRISSEFVSGRELLSNSEVKGKLDMLVENKVATSVSGTYEMYYDTYSPYLLACKMICDNDQDLCKFLVKENSDTGYQRNKQADISKELAKIKKYDLSPGVYFIDMSDGEGVEDYVALSITKDNLYEKNFTIYFIGDKAFKRCNKFMKESNKYEKIDDKNNYEYIRYTNGKPMKNTMFKPFDKMVFNDKDKMIKYIDNWKNNIPTLYKYGITPKLSILLYGEPGTGKSTFAKAVAKHLGIQEVTNISIEYFDTERRQYRSSMFEPTVYSLDDIDCMCSSREDEKISENDNHVLYQLLEFLDNPPTCYYKANDGLFYPVSIVIASTNYIDKLDKAVKRHGRFDLHLEMKYLNRKQAEELCSLYDLKLTDVYDKEINKDFSISPAYLQALCIENVEKSLK